MEAKIEVDPNPMKLLEAFWALGKPISSSTLSETVFKNTTNNNLTAMSEETFRVTLKEMREKRLVDVYREDESGIVVKVEGHENISAALKKRDGKTFYAAAVTVDQVSAPNRKMPIKVSDSRWQNANEYLQLALLKPVLDGEAYTLPQVYVPPLAYYTETKLDDRKEIKREVRHVVPLMKQMLDWIKNESSEEQVRIISADAGCGKSSFARMFADTLIQKREECKHRVLLVPLHELPVGLSPREAFKHYAEASETKDRVPLDQLNPLGPTDPVLLILDGLDELSHQGVGGERAARLFAAGINSIIEQCAHKNRKIKVLLCGRPIAARDARESFQDEKQTYHLINYLPPETDDKYDYLPAGVFKGHDQRKEWWQKYSSIVNSEPKEIPDILLDEKLEAFTRLPLMLTLLAISYRDRDKLNQTDSTEQLPPNPFANSNQLPERMADVLAWLVGKFFVRKEWAKIQHPKVGNMGFADYRDLLGVLALASVQNNTGRTAKLKVARALCDPLGIGSIIQEYEAIHTAGLLDFAMTFFSKYSGKVTDSEVTFEFTVKPFCEYLAACALITAMKDCSERLGSSKHSGRRRKPWTQRELLLDLLKICGPITITKEIYDYLCEEVERRIEQGEDPQLGVQCRETFIRLINESLPRNDEKTGELVGGLPAEQLTDLTHIQMTAYSDRTEHALLCMLGSCQPKLILPKRPDDTAENEIKEWQATCKQQTEDWKNRYAVKINWPTKTSAADWLQRIRKHSEQYWDRTDPLPLIGFDLSKQILNGSDLIRADLRWADLQEANLQEANLRRADLFRANLQEANLLRADLLQADLRQANLFRANLRWANLRQADLLQADLQQADLLQADLQQADLFKTDLTGATYGDVKLDTPEGIAFLKSEGAYI